RASSASGSSRRSSRSRRRSSDGAHVHRLASPCGCGSHGHVHRLASPCGCGSHGHVHRLASPAAAARTLAPRRPAARTTMSHVRRGDTVAVIAGKERGKCGKVLCVLVGAGRVLVEKVNVIKKHQRPTQKLRQGGIIEREGALLAKGRTKGAGEVPLRLKVAFQQTMLPALMKERGYTNPWQVPRVEKVVINMGVGEGWENAKVLDFATADLQSITGQRPIVTRAKKSIANFHLREAVPTGAKVTLRGAR